LLSEVWRMQRSIACSNPERSSSLRSNLCQSVVRSVARLASKGSRRPIVLFTRAPLLEAVDERVEVANVEQNFG